MTETKFGYKVCYKKHGKRKLKIYLVTNSYDLAFWEVRWYETHSPPNRKTNFPITNVTWLIIPVKNYIEYKLLWRVARFKAISLSNYKNQRSIQK